MQQTIMAFAQGRKKEKKKKKKGKEAGFSDGTGITLGHKCGPKMCMQIVRQSQSDTIVTIETSHERNMAEHLEKKKIKLEKGKR